MQRTKSRSLVTNKKGEDGATFGLSEVSKWILGLIGLLILAVLIYMFTKKGETLLVKNVTTTILGR